MSLDPGGLEGPKILAAEPCRFTCTPMWKLTEKYDATVEIEILEDAYS